jgi:DsbC/DsbD-like thiol-disulfide interchange protein
MQLSGRLPILMTLLVAATLLGCGGGSAEGEVAESTVPLMRSPGDPVVTATLISERPYLEPGETAMIVINFAFPEDWHMYWLGKNDSGLPPTVEWYLPEGFVVGEPLWPTPERKVLPGDLLDHVYNEEWTLLYPLEVPAQVKTGDTVEITAVIDWLVCREACIAEGDTLSRKFPLAREARPRTGDRGAFLVARTRENLPRTANAGEVVSSWEETRLTLVVPEATALTFFPDHESALPLALLQEGTAEGDRLTLRFAPEGLPELPVSGILKIRDAEGAFRVLSLHLETPEVSG